MRTPRRRRPRKVLPESLQGRCASLCLVLAVLVGCGSSLREGLPEGASCLRSTECADGLACVERTCTADVGSIVGELRDSGTEIDAATDAGGVDAGAPDAGPGDAGPGDAGPGDAGPGDAGPGDAGPGDAGPGDAGPGDAAPLDSGA